MELSKSQSSALEYITGYARTYKREAEQTISEVLHMSNISKHEYESAVLKLKSHAKIALHFHPDRPVSNGLNIADLLLEQGEYKSQFETFISNGSVSAYPGGLRDNWEKKLFGGAYQEEGTTGRERPKYGALNLMLHADGPAPRFGSCYLLLSPSVSRRSTYTYLDSNEDTKEKGTYAEFDLIMAALMKETFIRDSALGERNLTPSKLVHHLLHQLESPVAEIIGKEPNRNLNFYIEAQVHGSVSLREDAEALVADPSFIGTAVGDTLEQLCEKYRIELYWHKGSVLQVKEVPADFRGPSMPSLAERVAHHNRIDAYRIGLAAADLKRDPASWGDRGNYEEVLQELKLLWHVLVKYGKPAMKSSM
ncbi:DUF3626 domain-containing protein [Paenibacillus sp. M1]|uniref:DUF3626 domain-containing protein n=1 Tax=Paenibacillus haidiansis TaxID=1574488 RepID=A0ABU7VPJ1_9BACL